MRAASTRVHGMGHSSSNDRLVAPVLRPTLLTIIALNVFRLLRRGARFAARHPVGTGVLVCIAALARLSGLLGLVLPFFVAVALLFGWARIHPASYRRVVVSRWRWFWIYRYKWQPAMVTCGLAVHLSDREYLPKIRRVVCDEFQDEVQVRMLVGQSPEEYEAQVGQLAHTFGALGCRVRVDRPGQLWLEFEYGDPLATTIPAMRPQAEPDLEALRLGTRADGQPWILRLLGSHVLVAGATGAGKGSVVWSLIGALGPRVREGSVQLWAVDPKGGMELTPGADLFTRFAYESHSAMVDLLEDAVSFMRERSELLRQSGQRVLEPSVEMPLVVIVVDELAALTAYVGDRDLKRRAESAIQLLLSQGRAPGVLVVAAVQDPGKDVVAFRDLFPTRIALRLLEDVQVDMVLGRSARQHGATCDSISPGLPGVGYVVLEGVREPVRVRSAYVSDRDLAEMVSDYAPRHQMHVVEDQAS
ncbi:MAG: FtsK/SpoIIIE domain-containing protein [Actinomycetes bacterium]